MDDLVSLCLAKFNGFLQYLVEYIRDKMLPLIIEQLTHFLNSTTGIKVVTNTTTKNNIAKTVVVQMAVRSMQHLITQQPT